MSRPLTLITGASSGIGATYARHLARRGHDLLLVARNEARLQALASQLKAETGVDVEVLVADLGDPQALRRVEQRIVSDGRLSMLINNAGIVHSPTFTEADPDELEALLQLNVVALTRLSAAAARRFAEKGDGTLVNIASVTALMPESFDPAYLSSKAYVLAFSQALHQQLSPHGIRVQVVLPGITRTEIWDHASVKLDALPAEMIMEVDDLVGAALSGLDQGELVTIPSLPDIADWDRLNTQRLALVPHLSRRTPAARYG